MPRPRTKEDLISEGKRSYDELMKFVDSMSEVELNTPFDFSSLNKKEAHWTRDKNLRDVLMHLYEWHQLMLKWMANNRNGKAIQFLMDGFSWANYGKMNMLFFERTQNVPLDEAKKLLEKSHDDVMAAIEPFTTEELFTKNVFPWVGGWQHAWSVFYFGDSGALRVGVEKIEDAQEIGFVGGNYGV